MGNLCCCSRKENEFSLAERAYAQYTSSVDKDRAKLTEALELYRNALNKRREKKKPLAPVLIAYSKALYTHYADGDKSEAVLDEVIRLEEEAFGIFEATQNADVMAPGYERLLLNLGEAYLSQFKSSGKQASFESGIEKYKTLQFNSKASPELRRSGAFVMADALIEYAEDETTTTRPPEERKLKVEQAIDYLGRAKSELGSEQSTSKKSSKAFQESKTFLEKCLCKLAIAHYARYTIEKKIDEANAISDLDYAIQYNREAREMLVNSKEVALAYCLFELAQQLSLRYQYYRDNPQGNAHDSDNSKTLEEVKRFAKEGIDVIDKQQLPIPDHVEELKVALSDLLTTAQDEIDNLPPNRPSGN